MARPARTAALRDLHARRETLTAWELARRLAAPADPLALRPLAERLWLERALLVPVERLHARAAARIAAGFHARARDERGVAWIEAELGRAGDALRREDPRRWRDERARPSAFEQSVASCFGIADARAARLVRRFHELEDDERRALHALLPHDLLGLDAQPPGPPHRSRARSRDAARRGLATLRRLLAEVALADGRADPTRPPA